MLRPALELAWIVGRVGLDATPRVVPPGPMRPLMGFAKLPERALTTVRRVVEEDDAFRARAAEVADEALLGRVPWLWLSRPEGWEGELRQAVEQASAAASEVEEGKAERSARRRLAATERALTRAEEQLVAAVVARDGATAELAEQRRMWRAAETARSELEAALAAASEHAAELEQTRRQADVAAGTAAGRVAELEQERAALMADRDRARARADRLSVELAGVRRALGEQEAAAAGTRETLGAAIADAAKAADRMGQALLVAATALGGVEADRPRAAEVDSEDPGAPVVAAPRPPRRVPLALPPAVFDDSVEAAGYLVRVPDAVLLVDGYNVSLQTWPGVELEEQRHRLVSAVSELAMRTGVSALVAWDGSAQEAFPAPTGIARSAVRVMFSAPGEDADEVIIEQVDRRPPDRPVVVATDDRRVRDEVRRRGANVISTGQLLGVLGRRGFGT